MPENRNGSQLQKDSISPNTTCRSVVPEWLRMLCYNTLGHGFELLPFLVDTLCANMLIKDLAAMWATNRFAGRSEVCRVQEIPEIYHSLLVFLTNTGINFVLIVSVSK